MFYTLEGIDGAGCGVVRRELEKLLRQANINFETLKYPVPSLPFGRDIYDYLDGKFEMPTQAQFLAFIGQMLIEKSRIKTLRRHILIIDRYLPCTLVFQGAKGFPLEKGLELAKLLELETPDRIFYLKVPWQVAYDRKNKESRQSDVHEANPELFRKTALLYNKVAKAQILAPWSVIDATQTPQEEAEQIFEFILKDLKHV